MRTRLGLLRIYATQEAAGVKTLQETLQIDPDQVLAHRALAQYYQRFGEPGRALHHGAEALRIAGGAPQDFVELANQYLESGKPHEARLLLEKARFDHPENAAVAARLAIATLRDGDTASAARVFREAEALAKESKDPAAKEALDADYQLEFAASLRTAGDLTAAESRLRDTIRTIPADEPKKSAHAMRELARLWLEQDKKLGLEGLLKRAESLDPDNPETKTLLDQLKSQQ
jgi:Tfp pilus assembly protein PilF